MQVKQVTHTVLTASEGHILTNGTSYGYSVALGIYDSPENWYEIPIEEYENISLSQEQLVSPLEQPAEEYIFGE